MTDNDPNARGGPGDELQRFALSVERDPDGVHVRIVGELDISTVAELDNALVGLAAGAQGGRLLLDLDGVEFMDSTGLAGLIRAQQLANQNGHKLTIRSSAVQVQKFFDLSGMRNQFTFEP